MVRMCGTTGEHSRRLLKKARLLTHPTLARLVPSKAAASEGAKAYPLGYVEGLNDARTLLADFLSSPLVLEPIRVYTSYKATGTSEN